MSYNLSFSQRIIIAKKELLKQLPTTLQAAKQQAKNLEQLSTTKKLKLRN